MCGIIGAISHRHVTDLLVDGLKRLEYRGYDSAGVAVLHDNAIHIMRSKGKLAQLEELLATTPLPGTVGIGHTRWATHGAPTDINAHPHRSRDVVVVHNGIIENYQELRRMLQRRGFQFTSETDTEVIPHLIQSHLNAGLEVREAIRESLGQLHGAYALGILILGHEEMLVAARRGSPLIVAMGEGENFIASDATPLVSHTRRMIYLHDNDVAFLTQDKVEIQDLQGRPVERPVSFSRLSADMTEKWPYRHYMQKEIHEQPSVVGETLKDLLHGSQLTVEMEQHLAKIQLGEIQSVTIVACGTSWHAGLVGKYWIEELARLPVVVDIASEYRYREPPSLPNTLMIGISQSGETADTLAAIRFAKSQGQPVLAIVNVAESSVAREADGVIHTLAGPEIGVASTKAFTTQLAVLACLALALAKARGHLDPRQEGVMVQQLLHLPSAMEKILEREEEIIAIARRWATAKGFLFLGRGSYFPIALEGALKLKEISYIHAEGYAAGEMKHGPIALIDESLPVVVITPKGRLAEKTHGNLEEVRARGGKVIAIATRGSSLHGQVEHLFDLEDVGEFAAPMLAVLPLQMLAYHIAVQKGTDVDQPRNLAKSVTVE
ncbi:MAG: glutamine--fructose-6-phosphate transaminase (isomerizing) [Magnetococcales bacterium]|nr:glutamine--fructose-6-phosphate transaminase (isomerizing) [Magnetococcales bacterium]NGZ27186.1 glutamine--fructose-6-phosphate transaminase (isomerizing) [Magnetococcales bacterium]